MLIETDNYKIIMKNVIYKINEIHPLLEIKRDELYDYIKYSFIKILYRHIEPSYLQKKGKTNRQRNDELLSLFIMDILSENNIVDPLIPYNCSDDAYDGFELYIKSEIAKIREYDDTQKNDILKLIMNDIKNELSVIFIKSFDKLYEYYNSDEFNSAKQFCDKLIIEENGQLHIYYYNYVVTINKHLYNKVYDRFTDSFPINLDKDMYIWCLCKRYIILSSMNNQLAVHPKTMNDLQKKFNINFELFGSVFNTYNTSYCSLFYDIEKYFGSKGSFFDIQILSGNFSMNPPFDKRIIKKSIALCEHFMNKYNNIFVIIWIPIWDSLNMYNFVYKKCRGKLKSLEEKDQRYKDVYGVEKPKQQDYEGYNIIINSNHQKHVRMVCSDDMTYVNYNTLKKKYVAYTYMIGFSNNIFNKKLLDKIKLKH